VSVAVTAAVRPVVAIGLTAIAGAVGPDFAAVELFDFMVTCWHHFCSF